ncbi:protein of unknown function (plasmid) [Cupriavidus taiwanensis]|uniref:Uncharacterized protein n=1 Tax=Cupriavidus taiwanensis TaxID=164546 RepID=A0A9Q7UY98_9BURK|nr:protein of unknown function [Cupriavidus taiwanensis]
MKAPVPPICRWSMQVCLSAVRTRTRKLEAWAFALVRPLQAWGTTPRSVFIARMDPRMQRHALLRPRSRHGTPLF